MNQLLYFISVCTALLFGRADQSFRLQPKANKPYLNDSVSSVIPFTRAGNLIMVQARVDTLEGNFILDTGAPHLVLNVTYFRDYPITTTHDEDQTGISGSSAGVSRTKLDSFQLGELKYEQPNADMANLGHIENSKGVKILGLIGLDLLRNCELIIDYEQNLIYLHRISKKEASGYQHVMLNDTSSYMIIPFDLVDSRIIVNTNMKGKKLKFVVDCAAESNVLDSRLPNKILEQVTITRRVVLTGANNKKVDALYGDIQSLRIGNEETGKLPVLVTNLENTCFSYAGCVDGVLGFDFLSLHKVGFNFVKRKMYIWK